MDRIKKKWRLAENDSALGPVLVSQTLRSDSQTVCGHSSVTAGCRTGRGWRCQWSTVARCVHLDKRTHADTPSAKQQGEAVRESLSSVSMTGRWRWRTFVVVFPPLWVIVSEPRCSSNVQCCTRAFHPSYSTFICMFLCTPLLSVLGGWMHQRVFMYVRHAPVCILLFTCPCLRRCDRNHASAASFSTISRVRLASLWKTEYSWAWKTSHVHSWPIRPLQSGEEEQSYGAFIHKLLLLKFR